MSKGPFAIDPERVADEFAEFNGKLLRGLSTLAQLSSRENGVSPRDPVYKEDHLTLYRYHARVERPNRVPLLIVYALVNRPYMMDLQEGRSLIAGLLDTGLDVYLLDWGYPDAGDDNLTLDDYINGYLRRCIDLILERHGIPSVNLLGICQGGTFSLCFAALHREKVKNLITTVTPVDFRTDRDLLSHLVRRVNIDQCVDVFGNIPGAMLNWIFLSLRPFYLLSKKYVDVVDILDDEQKAANFLRMEKWIFDSPDQAGSAYRQFVKDLYQDNKLIAGALILGGRSVNLGVITAPVLNIYARDDHLVPPAASKALAHHIGSPDYTEIEFPGGHIGIYVSASAQSYLPPAIGAWLHART